MAVRGSGRRKSAVTGAASAESAGADARETPPRRRSRAISEGTQEQAGKTAASEPASPAQANEESRAAAAETGRDASREEERTPPPAEHVAVAAYYLAERRGFSGDQQVEDWLAAERALAAEFAGTGDDEAAARGAVKEDIQPDEVEQWAETLHVTPEQLRVAIQRVGPVSSEVRKFLQQSQGR